MLSLLLLTGCKRSEYSIDQYKEAIGENSQKFSLEKLEDLDQDDDGIIEDSELKEANQKDLKMLYDAITKVEGGSRSPSMALSLSKYIKDESTEVFTGNY